MIDAIRDSDISGIAENLANVLESVTIKLHPEIEEIKTKLINSGALGVLMSGSGPTVFGLAEDMESARAVAGRYKRDNELVLVTTIINH